ncbi:phage tail domain-containing protein [Schinkia azotoformans]|uniref:phage tail domain-containing protein n=1 Tax=Schinkia azotoformans TaxID=1454 RepID=UPI002DB6EA41|nr:phage tail domain-containing protein [Schinkia azotoformans]MEC1778398.1 phage tail family protein [Schinkia azotoformans]MED4328357.1 phage tail family protein [Schinkia azotoformans]
MEKSVFNFKIQKQDGTIIDLHEHNLFVNSFRIISLSPEHIVEQIDNRHGSIYLGTRLRERRITSQITVEANNYNDFDSLKHELYKLFNPLEKFYIIRDLQPTRRMEVSVANEFDIDYIYLEMGEFKIDFVIHSVYSESVGSTLNPTLNFQVRTHEPVQYRFNTSTFKVFNDGDIKIDPREMELNIIFKGNSDNLIIRNLTTNDQWEYSGTTLQSDTIELSGIRSFMNGFSIFGETNRRLITIDKGWNEFKIINATDFEISFDFRFKYI